MSIRGPAWEVTFATRRELESYLQRHGRRVAQWNVDGTFTTEPIPGTRCGDDQCPCRNGSACPKEDRN